MSRYISFIKLKHLIFPNGGSIILLNQSGYASLRAKVGWLSLKGLTKFNISLMWKWWWKLGSDTGPWQEFIWRKYLRNYGTWYAKHRATDASLWTDMMHI
jgi:hypothetical protein